MDSNQVGIESNKRFQVTYLNWLSGERAVLIDDVDAETAAAVVAKWGNKRDPNFYMPETRIEPMKVAS